MKSDFGLIGKKLGHSFSRRFFNEKFQELGLTDHRYHLFEIDSIEGVKYILDTHETLKGLNVTIPYKEDILKILDSIDPKAERIGSVNVVKIGSSNTLSGFNTDYYGFKKSLVNWIPANIMAGISAVILGTGGASKAVCCALDDLGIEYRLVSRYRREGILDYEELKENPQLLKENHLIINTTPLGMYPNSVSFPEIDYNTISKGHYTYDLVYNPEETVFMKRSKGRGAHAKNGLEMLHLQAEKSWEIWNE